MINLKSTSLAFTIVELLVVIVVIGILASITVVSYTGISQKAKVASIKSDLSSASKRLKLFQVTSSTSDYPTANVCPSPGATEICLKSSDGNTYTYTPNNASNPKTFTLKATNGSISYSIAENSSPTEIVSLAVSDPVNWIQIGTQVWAKKNLNVGMRIADSIEQTNNAINEKYCYGNSELNCTNYGGLYSWEEAMGYSTTEGVRGICPVGSHIPTDNEWKKLEMYLGMSQAQADATGLRGTDQGTKLKSGGVSGFSAQLGGYFDGMDFGGLSTHVEYWSSTEYVESLNMYTPVRILDSGFATVGRDEGVYPFSYSVRCLEN